MQAIKELIGLFGLIIIMVLSIFFAITGDISTYLEDWLGGQADLLNKWVTKDKK